MWLIFAITIAVIVTVAIIAIAKVSMSSWDDGWKRGYRAASATHELFSENFGKFSDWRSAEKAWEELAVKYNSFPSVVQWLYMTDKDVKNYLNYDAAKAVSCKECVNYECAYRTGTCWKCVCPKEYKTKGGNDGK